VRIRYRVTYGGELGCASMVVVFVVDHGAVRADEYGFVRALAEHEAPRKWRDGPRMPILRVESSVGGKWRDREWAILPTNPVRMTDASDASESAVQVHRWPPSAERPS
jgi:hypothetical protein